MRLDDVRDSIEATNADLSRSSFVNVKLAEARFEDVNLSGATLRDVNLGNVTIAESCVDGMTIDGISVVEMLKAYAASQPR